VFKSHSQIDDCDLFTPGTSSAWVFMKLIKDLNKKNLFITTEVFEAIRFTDSLFLYPS